MKIVHLTSSRFFGGPERQMLELAHSMRPAVESVFLSFSEGGLCRSFLEKTKNDGYESLELEHDTPHLFAAASDLKKELRKLSPDFLLCHGYKSNLLGLWIARKLQIPIVSVSHGWTGESFRVRLYEAIDRRILRRMDSVVCVSEGQALKVRRCGVAQAKCQVICDAVRAKRFNGRRPAHREWMESLFPKPPRLIVGAVGRLSPEKGFTVLVDAAAKVLETEPDIGFILFGEGALRKSLERQILKLAIGDRFVLAGFRSDLDQFFPNLDILVQSSFTEGLPNVVLEAYAAGLPVVATAVGGTPEIIEEGINGFLTPSGQPLALARRIIELLSDDSMRERMAILGQQRIKEAFSFGRQAQSYLALFDEIQQKLSLGSPKFRLSSI